MQLHQRCRAVGAPKILKKQPYLQKDNLHYLHLQKKQKIVYENVRHCAVLRKVGGLKKWGGAKTT